MLATILIILVIMLLGALPSWPHARGWHGVSRQETYEGRRREGKWR